jgi:peptide deformylase
MAKVYQDGDGAFGVPEILPEVLRGPEGWTLVKLRFRPDEFITGYFRKDRSFARWWMKWADATTQNTFTSSRSTRSRSTSDPQKKDKIMPLLRPDDPRLYEKSLPVEDINGQVWPQMPNFLAIMNRAKFAVGLSAPQLGIMLRFFCYRNPGISYVINPVVLSRSKEVVTGREGCLSWAGKWAVVPRNKSLRVSWTDERGVAYEKDVVGLYAKVFQHEIDHLDGITIFPRPTTVEKTAEGTVTIKDKRTQEEPK